jgi:hypothetical protein
MAVPQSVHKPLMPRDARDVEPAPGVFTLQDEEPSALETEDGVRVEVVDMEDGGAEVTFGEEDILDPLQEGFGHNLALDLEEGELDTIASDVIRQIDVDLQSRQEWEKSYVKGLKLLGFSIEDRTTPWNGASGVHHPILSEAVIRAQAHLMAEAFPASGPVKSKVVGKITPEKEAQALRVKNDMNYQLTEKMPEYRPETEKLFFNLPLAGSVFRKIYFDPNLKRAAAMMVTAEDMIVPYGASDLLSSPHTHRIRKAYNDVKKDQLSGFYRDVDISKPVAELSRVEKEKAKAGQETPTMELDDRVVIYERSCDLELPAAIGDSEDGIARPYIITITKQDKKVLSIYRNWREEDETMTKRLHVAHYEYIPGLGFYGLGLIHLIGGITKTATSVLRQLIDAGTLANLPAGLKSRGLRIKGDNTPIKPGEFRDVDVPGNAIKDNITFLPYKEPSTVLHALLTQVVDEGRRIASAADMKISDMSGDSPVGTTLALLEHEMKIMSAVMARVYAAMRQEFKLLVGIMKDHAPEQYEYEVEGGDQFSPRKDYDDRVDIIPVANPNAATMAQRITTYQAIHQMSQTAPDVYDEVELHRGMLSVLGAENIDKLIPGAKDQKPQDPVTENMKLISGSPAKAFMYQDHKSHIAVHMAASEDPAIMALLSKSPNAQAIGAAMAAHVQEHLGYQYRREIEEQMGVEMPHPDEPMSEDVEVRLSATVAEAAANLLSKHKQEEQQKKAQEQEQDPVIQMQMAELEIKKTAADSKAANDEGKLALARAKAMSDADLAASKIASDEQIAGAKIGADAAESRQDAIMEGARIQSQEAVAGAQIGANAAAQKLASDNKKVDGDA